MTRHWTLGQAEFFIRPLAAGVAEQAAETHNEGMEGTIRKLGLEGGLWALITDDGKSVELIDPPAGLQQNGKRARVEGRRDTAEVSIGMVGDAIEVTSFEILD